MTESVNEIRRTALDRIERSERVYKLAFAAGVMLEAIFLVAFLLLMDRSNRVHVLLLIGTVASYSIVIIGLIALGAHNSRNTLRVLRALDLLRGGS